jgi:hypothetical protein
MKKIITKILVFTTTLLFSQVPSYVPTNGLVGLMVMLMMLAEMEIMERLMALF